jgi:hypothetical protein
LFLIITACVLAYYAQKRYFVLFPLVIILVFTVSNFKLLKDFLYTDVNNVDYITFANQTQAINWIYQDVSGKPFNTDVYVPPIVPAAYDYLIPWFGKTYFYHQPSGSEETLLYTLWEENPNNPEEVDTWLKRQSTYGKVQQSKTFGMVHVEQRIRKSAKIKN